MGFCMVSHLIAHARLEDQCSTIFQFWVQFTLQTKQDMTLGAPRVSLIDRFSVLLTAFFVVLFSLKELTGHLNRSRSVIRGHDHDAELMGINRQVTTANLSIEGLQSILKRLKQIDQTKAIEKVKVEKETRYFSLSETIGMLQDKIE